MRSSIITRGFIICGLVNILGVLLFSKFYTNEIINQYDPVVMSNFGLLMIGVWGLVFISVAKSYQSVPRLVLVFAIEKMIYSAAWITWMINNASKLGEIYSKDIFAGIFYTIYGPNDFLFMVFFGLVYYQIRKNEK